MIAAILVPVSIVTAWARVQLLDEDSFTPTLAPFPADLAAQAMFVDEISAPGLLTQPTAEGLESIVERAVTRDVTSDAFADVWAAAASCRPMRASASSSERYAGPRHPPAKRPANAAADLLTVGGLP